MSSSAAMAGSGSAVVVPLGPYLSRRVEPSGPEAPGSADMARLLQALADTICDRLEAKLEALLHQATLPQTTTTQPPAEWLDAEGAAQHLGMSKKALYTAVERGQIPASRLVRRLRFARAGLDHLLANRQRRAVQPVPRVPSPGKESER